MCLFRPAAGRTALQHGVERTDGIRVFSGDARRQQPQGFLLEPFFVEKAKNNFFFKNGVSFSNQVVIFRV